MASPIKNGKVLRRLGYALGGIVALILLLANSHGCVVLTPQASVGALYLRVYASRFHGDVAGMILVDRENDDTLKRIPESGLSSGARAELLLGPFLTRIGLVRLAGLCGARTWVEDPSEVIPTAIETMSVAVECRPSFVHSEASYQWALEQSAEEARMSGTLGNIPLVVVSRDPCLSPECLQAQESATYNRRRPGSLL